MTFRINYVKSGSALEKSKQKGDPKAAPATTFSQRARSVVDVIELGEVLHAVFEPGSDILPTAAGSPPGNLKLTLSRVDQEPFLTRGE
jgi:hypothetical protein